MLLFIVFALQEVAVEFTKLSSLPSFVFLFSPFHCMTAFRRIVWWWHWDGWSCWCRIKVHLWWKGQGLHGYYPGDDYVGPVCVWVCEYLNSLSTEKLVLGTFTWWLVSWGTCAACSRVLFTSCHLTLECSVKSGLMASPGWFTPVSHLGNRHIAENNGCRADTETAKRQL